MIPPQPKNSYRIKIEISVKAPRLDSVLMDALRNGKSLDLKTMTRMGFKKLFQDKKILIKGQPARPSSSLSAGTTYVDILGFDSETGASISFPK